LKALNFFLYTPINTSFDLTNYCLSISNITNLPQTCGMELAQEVFNLLVLNGWKGRK
jgi:hypothetical protein